MGDVRVRAENLGPDELARLLCERQRAYAAPAVQTRTDTRRVLVWTLAGERYASLAEDVREVVPLPRIARVPGAPAALVGLVSRHGMIHNLFDPGPVLGAGRTDPDANARMLVLQGERPRIALRVSSAEGMEELPVELARHDGLTRFVAPAEGAGFTLVSLPHLIERLLAGRDPTGG